jgi:hypothetical protein
MLSEKLFGVSASGRFLPVATGWLQPKADVDAVFRWSRKAVGLAIQGTRGDLLSTALHLICKQRC